MTSDNEKLQLQILPDKNLFVFPDHMQEANRDAAKASHALATQGANKRYNPISQTKLWFKEYIRLMSAMGWVSIRTDVQEITASNMHLEISNLLGKGLMAAKGVLTGDVAEALKNLGEAVVAALAASTRNVEVLDYRSVEDDRTSLSLNKCEQSPGGQVAMLVSAIQTDAEPDKASNLLLFKWESSGTTNFACGAVLVFDQRRYQKARPIIEGKLDDKALETLLVLEL